MRRAHPSTAAGAAAALLLAVACASPNRGVWAGTFAGSVSGVVEFRINARGSKLTGTIVGATRDQQPFEAEMEGKIRGRHFYATFEGMSRSGLHPVPFTGLMRGELGDGAGAGDWTAELKLTGTTLTGTWEVSQVASDGAAQAP